MQLSPPPRKPPSPAADFHKPGESSRCILHLRNRIRQRKLATPAIIPTPAALSRPCLHGRLWTMRQYAGMGDAEESNRGSKFLLASGTAASVGFDLPTQIGYDSDDPMSIGEVGVSIDSIEDMQQLFDGIPLDKISTSMTINSTTAFCWRCMLQLRGAPDKRKKSFRHGATTSSRNTSRAEPIFIRSGTPCASSPTCSRDDPTGTPSPSPAITCVKPARRPCRKLRSHLTSKPQWTRASILTSLRRGSRFFNAHSNFLEEIAKFRAARRMWAHIMREEFGAKNPRSWMLRFHTQTAGSTLTAQQAGKRHCPHRRRSHGCHPRRHAVVAHQRIRRGAGAAKCRAHRAAHAEVLTVNPAWPRPSIPAPVPTRLKR